jgi:hypothetical protein
MVMRRIPVPKYLRNRCLIRDGYKCLNCGRGINTAIPLPPGVTLDVHHLYGNSHDTPSLETLRTLCSECNRSLQHKLIPLTNEVPKVEITNLDLSPVIEAITKLRSPIKPIEIPFIPYCCDMHCLKYKGDSEQGPLRREQVINQHLERINEQRREQGLPSLETARQYRASLEAMEAPEGKVLGNHDPIKLFEDEISKEDGR